MFVPCAIRSPPSADSKDADRDQDAKHRKICRAKLQHRTSRDIGAPRSSGIAAKRRRSVTRRIPATRVKAALKSFNARGQTRVVGRRVGPTRDGDGAARPKEPFPSALGNDNSRGLLLR